MTPTADTRAAIDAANQKFMAAFGRQDSARIASLYTTDGQLFPSNSDIVNGAAGIQAFWQGAFGMGLKEFAVETVELDVQGETAIEVGRYILKADRGVVADQGKYIIIWKHAGGTWKLHRDIWNTNQPAA